MGTGRPSGHGENAVLEQLADTHGSMIGAFGRIDGRVERKTSPQRHAAEVTGYRLRVTAGKPVQSGKSVDDCNDH